MAQENIKILLVEDNIGDARMVREILSENNPGKFVFVNAGSIQEAAQCLSTSQLDAVLLDMSLPDSHGLETIEKMCSAAPTTPIIVLTGLKDEQIGVEAVRLGAQDYIVKGQTDGRLLRRTIEYAVERKRVEEELKKTRSELEIRVQQRTAELAHTVDVLQKEVLERTTAETKLTEQSRILEVFFRHTNNPLVFLDRDFNFIRVNEAYAKACQRNISDFSGHNHFEFYPDQENQTIFENVVRTKKTYEAVAKPFVFPDHPEWGVTYWDWTLVPISDISGKIELLIFSLRDVTEHKSAEDKLRASEEKYRDLVENANSIILRMDINGTVTFFNEFAQKFFGFSENEIIGRNVIGTIVPQTDSTGRNLAAMIKDIGIHPGHYSTNENENICRDGRRVWISWTNKHIRDASGRIVEILCVGNDVTDRKHAEEKLQSSEEKYRELVENANSIILRRDISGKITFFNEFDQKFFGFSENEIIGQNAVGTIIPPRDSSQRDMAEMIKDIGLHPERYSTHENENICRDGRRVWISWTNKPILDKKGRVIEILAVGNDITERKQAEKKILADQEQLRSLTGELLAVEERERREIAVELHDSLGQILAFAKIEAGNLRKLNPSEKLLEHIEQIRNLLEEAIKQTRMLTFNISPPELYTLGLEAALEELAGKFSAERKLQCFFKNTSQPKPLTDSVKVLLYRAVRELLINIAKHANAAAVYINVRRVNKDILITVEDDGAGFDTAKLETESNRLKSFGLFSIHQRITHIGGRFEIQSCPGEGTKVSLFAPLNLKKRNIRK